MCEQCMAKTETYSAPKDQNGGRPEDEVLPGYALIRATQDGWMMQKGDWGLVACNDPDYWWGPTPVEDPWAGLTDDQIDALEDQPQDSAWDLAVAQIELALDGRTERMLAKDVSGYPRFDDAVRLYKAAAEAGFDPDRDGRFAHWLCHRLAVFLKTAKAVPEPPEVEPPAA